jgi:glycosyltransferase involved in cell wall biosynthesis
LRPDGVLLGPEPYDAQVLAALVALTTLRAPTVVSLAMENRVALPGGWRTPLILGLWRRLDGVAAAAEATLTSYRTAGLPTSVKTETLAAAVLPPPATVIPLDLRATLPAATFIVGFVGRLVEEKGITVLLDAVEQCDGVGLVLAGSGPLEQEVRRRTSGALRGRLVSLGLLTRDDVWRMLASIDALALPSLARVGWSEQFGYVLAEAMALSVPVIGSRSGGIPEVIGDAGLIVEEASVTELADAILKLAEDAALSSKLGAIGRHRYESEFTIDACAGRISRLFDRCRRR